MGNVQHTAILDTCNIRMDKQIKDILNKYQFEYYDDFIKYIQTHNSTDLMNGQDVIPKSVALTQKPNSIVYISKIKKYIISFVEMKRSDEIRVMYDPYIVLRNSFSEMPKTKYYSIFECSLHGIKIYSHNFSLDPELYIINDNTTHCKTCSEEHSTYNTWYNNIKKLDDAKRALDIHRHETSIKYDFYKPMIDELANHILDNYIRETYLLDNEMAKRTITLKGDPYKVVTIEEIVEAVYNGKVFAEAKEDYDQISNKNIEKAN